MEEGGGSYRVDVSSEDGEVEITVAAHRAAMVMADSVFGSVEQASEFFRCAPLGYAAAPKVGAFDGVALAAEGWAIEPLHLDEVRSSFFERRDRFAAGTAVADSAFLMAGLETCWRPQPVLVAGPERFSVPRAGQPFMASQGARGAGQRRQYAGPWAVSSSGRAGAF